MSLNKIFIFFTWAFLVWVFFCNLLIKFEYVFLFTLIAFCSLIFLFFVLKKHHKFVIFLALGLFFWILYSYIFNTFILEKQKFIDNYLDKNVFIKAEIIELNKQNDYWNTYLAKIYNKKINFLLQTWTNSSLEKWQIISFTWKIEEISNFSQNFNYSKYLLSKNIYFKTSSFNYKIEWNKKLSSFESKTIKLRKIIFKNITDLYPKKEAILLSGLLIWEKQNLPQEMTDAYSKSGLLHIISVSWSNISLIILFLWVVFRVIPGYIRFVLIWAFIVFYCFLVWIWISVIRASIMWILGYYALVSWRKVDNLALILFTAFLMILFNPLIINYDISFHLSFLAVIWILYTKDFYDKIFKFLPKKFAIRDSFVVAISATTTIFPIMLFNFWYISVLNPIVSMVTGWVLPLAMFFWIVWVVVNFISSNIWYYVWFIWYYLLSFINKVAFYVAWLKFSVIDYDFWVYSKFLQILYFLVIWFLIIYFNVRGKRLEE